MGVTGMTVTGRIGRLMKTEALVGLVAEFRLLTDPPSLRWAGLDGRRIADLSGQRTASLARPYSGSTSHADKNHRATAALEKDDVRRAKIV